MKTEKEIRKLLKHYEQLLAICPESLTASGSVSVLKQILGTDEPEIDKQKLYESAINSYGAEMQIVVAMEECSELIKELSKSIRGMCNLNNLAEEIADVEIMIEQLIQAFALESKVENIKECKILRLKQRLQVQFRGRTPVSKTGSGGSNPPTCE